MILDEIAERTLKRIEEEKKKVSDEEIRETAMGMPSGKGRPLEMAFEKEDFSFICEVKKASPSKGVIAPDFPYVEIAKEYEAAGAAAISVLTEPYFFQGRDAYLTEIAEHVSIPVLRKDFILDPYQIYQAKVIGASAILLISSLLTPAKLKMFTAVAQRLGMSTLVEAHTEEEVEKALDCGTEIIGVNNRDLKTFVVDLNTSIKLRKLVPENRFFVSESGIQNAEDIRRLRESAADAVLIGETLMRSEDKKAALDSLRDGAR
ncbi:MAG: indole-3-glycerol phosphate synthase TrpC [Firmicutes bacterium]|nr:indole-3-glycerol phosphate synthase TrpC [Bacillota bacterium]